jgi:hypothetical protein
VRENVTGVGFGRNLVQLTKSFRRFFQHGSRFP